MDRIRTPVAMLPGKVCCDDGSVWWYDNRADAWVEKAPVPGSLRERELANLAAIERQATAVVNALKETEPVTIAAAAATVG